MKKRMECIMVFLLLFNTLKSQNLSDLEVVLQHALDSVIASDGIPGATCCVVFSETQILNIASGYADVEDKQPMPDSAIIFSGSVGKTFVAASILKLMEQGKLQLSDKVKKFFDNEAWFYAIPNAHTITIQMLLNHTSGIPDYVYKNELWQTIMQQPDKNWSAKERLQFIMDDSAICNAGECWSYADANYIILGVIIEKVSEKSFYDFVDEHFIIPLQLQHTKPAIHRQIQGLASGYTGFTEEMQLPYKVAQNQCYIFNPQFEWTGGGFVTNVSDLAKWAKALYGGNVLNSASQKQMVTPSNFSTILFENARYGLGSFVGFTDKTLYYGHTGFVPGYATVMEYIPDYYFAMAIQMNTDIFPKNKHKMDYFNILKKIVIQHLKKFK